MLLLAVGGLFLWAHFRAPAPDEPLPKGLDKLDPQLRDYILGNLQFVRAAPRHADRHATIGLIYAVNGLWPEARVAFQNAARLDPDEPLPQMYTGISDQELGELDGAIKIFRNTTHRFPSFAPGFYRLGYASVRAGHRKEAETAFGRLVTLAPDEWRGYAGLGEVMLGKGQFTEAASLLEKAVQLDPTAKTAHHLLGQAYQHLGGGEEAQWELQLGKNAVDSPMPDAWAKLAPRHIKTLQGQSQLAVEFSEAGEPVKAAEILAQALVFHPNEIGLMNQFAIALDRCGEPAKAKEVLARALAKNERYVPAVITLSLCQQKLGENEQALATAERAISLAPNVAPGYVAQANAFLALERDEEALKALEKAAQLDPQNPELPMQIGDILWRNLDRPIEARERYETARNLDPTLPPVYVRLADLELKMGETDKAENCILKLRRLTPDLPDLTLLEQRLRQMKKR